MAHLNRASFPQLTLRARLKALYEKYCLLCLTILFFADILALKCENKKLKKAMLDNSWKSCSTGREGYKSCNSECASWGLPTLESYNFQIPQVIFTSNTLFKKSNQ